METLEKRNIKSSSKQDLWFDEIISGLRTDELLKNTGLLDKEKERMYNVFIENDTIKIAKYAQAQIHKDLTKLIIYSYLIETFNRGAKPKTLAFDYSSKGVLVWAVIKNDDEKTEDALILSEAKINYQLADKFDYHISTTIIEEEDNVSIPKQYKTL